MAVDIFCHLVGAKGVVHTVKRVPAMVVLPEYWIIKGVGVGVGMVVELKVGLAVAGMGRGVALGKTAETVEMDVCVGAGAVTVSGG